MCFNYGSNSMHIKLCCLLANQSSMDKEIQKQDSDERGETTSAINKKAQLKIEPDE